MTPSVPAPTQQVFVVQAFQGRMVTLRVCVTTHVRSSGRR